MNMDQKLDELIKCVADLKRTYDTGHKELEGKLLKLEADVQ